jgi:hypothetical protein
LSDLGFGLAPEIQIERFSGLSAGKRAARDSIVDRQMNRAAMKWIEVASIGIDDPLARLNLG